MFVASLRLGRNCCFLMLVWVKKKIRLLNVLQPRGMIDLVMDQIPIYFCSSKLSNLMRSHLLDYTQI